MVLDLVLTIQHLLTKHVADKMDSNIGKSDNFKDVSLTKFHGEDWRRID